MQGLPPVFWRQVPDTAFGFRRAETPRLALPKWVRQHRRLAPSSRTASAPRPLLRQQLENGPRSSEPRLKQVCAALALICKTVNEPLKFTVVSAGLLDGAGLSIPLRHPAPKRRAQRKRC